VAGARVGVATFADDLHALLIARGMEELEQARCYIIEVDRLSGGSTMSWTDGEHPENGCTLPTRCGRGVDVRTLDALWWRRVQRDQRLPEALTDPAQVDLVNNDCGAALAGTLLTRTVTERHLASPEAMAVSPAMYQEHIPGTRHVRAQCFGERVIAVLITAEALDWRARLDSDIRPWTTPDAIRARLLEVMRTLGLKMGIVDLKLTDDDECVWLEVNQQGQFLFLEGLTGLPLTAAFCRFLSEEAERVTG